MIEFQMIGVKKYTITIIKNKENHRGEFVSHGGFILVQPKIAFRSSSGVEIGAIPKFSTR